MGFDRLTAKAFLALVMLASACHVAVAGKLRPFPSTWAKTRVFADQFGARGNLDNAQIRFAASHFVGTQKIKVDLIQKLRAINPHFLVLHYHLAVWQSGEHVPFIIDGRHWGNDYNFVNQHENWFLHDAQGHRLEAPDHKLLMNVTNPHYEQYLVRSLIKQVRAGHDDGVFLDSWSTPAVYSFLHKNYPQWRFPAIIHPKKQLGGLSWIQASDQFMHHLTDQLNKAGIWALPNIGDLITTWDHTNYAIPNGGMMEDAPESWSRYGQKQWIESINKTLKLVRADKILMLESYLGRHKQNDVQKRLYWLGTYLLLRGHHTYITYFADRPFEYYPEFDIDLGTPTKTARKNIADLKQGPLYVRPFTKGLVAVNSDDHKTFHFTAPPGYSKVTVQGGGIIDAAGKTTGKLLFLPANSSIALPPHSAAIFVKAHVK